MEYRTVSPHSAPGADEHGVVGQRVLPGELPGARLEALADVEHVLPDVPRLLDEQVELREAAAAVEQAGLLTPTRGPNGYRRYVSADIDHIEKGTHMDDKEKFEGMKRELVEDNERTYGQEVRERWGDAAADGANRKMPQPEQGPIRALPRAGTQNQ